MFSEHKESGEGQKRDCVCKALQSTGDNWRCTLWFNMQGYPVKCRDVCLLSEVLTQSLHIVMKCIGIKSCMLKRSKSPCIQNQVDSIFPSKWALKMIFLHKFAGWTSVCFNSRIIESSRAWSVCRQCITEHNEWELPDWSCCAIIDTLKTSLHFSFWVCAFCFSHCTICSASQPNNSPLILSAPSSHISTQRSVWTVD